MRLISNEEVSRHTTLASCWVVVHGKVYDVTSLLKLHPGGVAAITSVAGGNATTVFDEVHHESILHRQLAQYAIGWVEGAPSEEPEEWSPFPHERFEGELTHHEKPTQPQRPWIGSGILGMRFQLAAAKMLLRTTTAIDDILPSREGEDRHLFRHKSVLAVLSNPERDWLHCDPASYSGNRVTVAVKG